MVLKLPPCPCLAANSEGNQPLLGNNKDASKSTLKLRKILCTPLFPCIPARVVLAIVMYFGGFAFYVIRTNMSVAIVAMVNATADHRNWAGNSTSQTCHPTAQTFQWTNEEQGFLLSGFFYGYVLLQLPGGYLATKLSAKLVIFCGIAIPGILSILTPVVMSFTTSFAPILVIRILQGVFGSMVFPSFQALIGRWSLPHERSRMTVFLVLGGMSGSIVTFPMAGWLCKCGFAGGWPSVFYVSGIVSLVWCVFWLFLVYDSPSTHPRISQKELIYIQTSLQSQNKGKPGPIPWLKILTSWAVWGDIVALTTGTFGLYTLLTGLPTYLKDTQGVDINANGLLSAIPFAAGAISALSMSFLTDFIISRGWFPVVAVRKVNVFIGKVGSAILLVMCGYFGTTTLRAVSLMAASQAIGGIAESGELPNIVEIAPQYAGVIMGIANTFGSVSGIVGPLIAKSIASAPLSEVSVLREQWREVFILAAEIYVFGAIVFAVLASGQVQPWARVNNNNKNNNNINSKNNEVDSKDKKVNSAAPGGISNGVIRGVDYSLKSQA